jgi:hypothetical protein
MIRMLIVGYVFAIRSERALCRDVRVNLAYRWFCGLSIEDKIPDHSVNYLVDVKFGIIMDVEASRAIRQAEVGAAKPPTCAWCFLATRQMNRNPASLSQCLHCY